MAKNENRNYLNDSKIYRCNIPRLGVSDSGAPRSKEEKKESDHLWSSTGAEEKSEESAPGPPAARRGGKKRNLQFS